MKDFLLMALGASLGAIIGAGLGIGAGLVYVEWVHASCFEGACGFAVAGCFLPLGGLIGMGVGAATVWHWSHRLSV